MRRSILKGFVLFLLGCLIPFYAIACSPQQPTTSNTDTASPTTSSQPLVVGVQPWIGFRGHFVATDKDMFTPEGIKVEEKFFQTATDTNTALVAGQVDMAWTGAADLLTLVAQAPDLKIIMASDYSNGADGILGRNISKPEDMRGKKVAREDAPYAIVFLSTYLAKAGLTEKDLQVVPLAAGDAMTAFVAGQVDAATTYEPWLSKAKDNIIFTSKDTSAVPIILAAKAETIQNKKNEILAYLKAVDKAIAFADANPQEAAEICAKKLGVTPDEIPAQLAGIHPFNIKTNKEEAFNLDHPLSLVKSLDAASQTLTTLGKIPQPIDAKTLVDDSLIKSL